MFNSTVETIPTEPNSPPPLKITKLHREKVTETKTDTSAISESIARLPKSPPTNDISLQHKSDASGQDAKVIDKITHEAKRKASYILGKSDPNKKIMLVSLEQKEVGRNYSWLMRTITKIVATVSPPMKTQK